MAELNGYELSRSWFDWCFENPDLVSPNHSAIFFFAIEHCNRLGWKDKFGFPTQMTMDAIGIKKHQTYIKYFNDLVEWGFIKLVQKSQNQYSANIICLQCAKPKSGKALDKANINHAAKQTQKQLASIGQSTWQSNSSINKQINNITNKPINQEQEPTPSEVKQVIEYLNFVTGSSFRPESEKNKKHVVARLNEKFTIEDFRAVVDHKFQFWGSDPKMKEYLRPETLFGTKFEGYLQAAKNPVKPPEQKSNLQKTFDAANQVMNEFLRESNEPNSFTQPH